MTAISASRATLAGCIAIVLWSATVGLLRNMAELLGPVGGAAMVYSMAALFLLVLVGAPRLGAFSRRYLLAGGALFVSYEICLALALGLANDRVQAIELGVINYLWPSLTVLVAVLLSPTPFSKWLYPALGLSFFGVAWTVSGDQGLSLAVLAANLASNPLAYTLALAGAVIWAFYCNITPRMAGGKNAITWFFMATAASLWVLYGFSDEPAMTFTTGVWLELAVTGLAMGAAYALWNQGIMGGNMVLLATLSYFTPVLSTLLSAQILDTELTTAFWQGVAMVTLASLACWWLTRTKTP